MVEHVDRTSSFERRGRRLEAAGVAFLPSIQSKSSRDHRHNRRPVDDRASALAPLISPLVPQLAHSVHHPQLVIRPRSIDLNGRNLLRGFSLVRFFTSAWNPPPKASRRLVSELVSIDR
jgi:hypothetical protein